MYLKKSHCVIERKYVKHVSNLSSADSMTCAQKISSIHRVAPDKPGYPICVPFVQCKLLLV